MSHANAALTPLARLCLAKLIVEEHWPVATAATMFMLSPPTARKLATRFRAEGPAGKADRSSRPSTMPTRTPPAVVKQIVAARWHRRLGPTQIAGELGMPASTVHAVLVLPDQPPRPSGPSHRRADTPLRAPPPRLADPRRRHHVRPHPRRGGHRFVGRQQGLKHRAATSDREGTRDARYQPQLGVGFLHNVIDDHSRFAYVEMHSDERSQTAITVLRRAVAHFARLGVEVERVLSDNGPAYRSHAWRDACTELGIKPKRTRPYRPQTNGKIERFHRTLADGWAYIQFVRQEKLIPKSFAICFKSVPGSRFWATRTTSPRSSWG